MLSFLLSFFGGTLIFLLTLIVMIISMVIIGITIIFVGYILEKTNEKHNGYFHKLIKAIEDI